MVAQFISRQMTEHHLFSVEQMLAIQEIVDQFVNGLGFVEPSNVATVIRSRYQEWASDYSIEEIKSIIMSQTPQAKIVAKEDVRFYEPLKPEL